MSKQNRTSPMGHRECRDRERVWNGHCVDKNLNDEWLIQLNNLSCFNLISICEGHPANDNRRVNASPHIILRIKDFLLPSESGQKELLIEKVRMAFIHSFTLTDINYTVEWKQSLHGRDPSWRQDFTIRMSARNPYNGVLIKGEWFDLMVEEINTFDKTVRQQLNVT